MEKTLDSLQKMQDEASAFVTTLKPKSYGALTIGLEGDLGSGKTTFVQDAGKSMGLVENLTSPTFIIEKIYDLPKNSLFKKFVHVDAYRLDSAEELQRLGFHEILKDKSNIVFIEWPEKIKSILPHDTKSIVFTFVNETTRKITYV